MLRVLPRLDRSRFHIIVWPFLSSGVLAPQFAAAGLTPLPPLDGNQNVAPSLSGNNFLASGGWQQPRRLPVASWRAFRPATRIARVARDHNVDVIHSVLPNAYLLASLAKPMAGRPALVMSRLSQNYYHRDMPLFGWVERNILHHCPDIVIGNSQSILDELEDEGLRPSKLRLIYNGIDVIKADVPQRPIARRELGLSESCLVLSMVANLFPYKGHAELIQALAAANPDLPGDWLLLVCGRNIRGGQASLIGLASALGIGSRIRFLGERNDIPSILAAADIHVSASHTEGFPNNILEAMSAGVPIIATAVGGVTEQIESGRSGLLIPPQNPRALADAIVKLASNPALRRALGNAAMDRAIRDFPLKNTIAGYEAVYSAAAFFKKTN